jgi:hypothetical protein
MQNQKFEIPKRLLEQLSECSRAYVMFVIDEDGDMCIYSDVPTQADSYALDKYISDTMEHRNEIDAMEAVDNYLAISEGIKGAADEDDDD